MGAPVKNNELIKAASFNQSDFHGLLMAYGVACEEHGALSNQAVSIRMDIAAHYNHLVTLKNEELN